MYLTEATGFAVKGGTNEDKDLEKVLAEKRKNGVTTPVDQEDPCFNPLLMTKKNTPEGKD